MKNKESYTPAEVHSFLRAYEDLMKIYGSAETIQYLSNLGQINEECGKLENAISNFDRIVPENVREGIFEEIVVKSKKILNHPWRNCTNNPHASLTS